MDNSREGYMPDRSGAYMLIGVRGVMLIGVRRGGVRDI